MPIIELLEGRHYYGFWWVAWDGTDWLCCAWREDGSTEVDAVYRFRYYRDDDPFSDKDKKSVFTMSIPIPGMDPQQAYRHVEDKLSAVAQLMAYTTNAHEAEYIRVDGDHHAAARALMQSSWAHVKKVKVSDD